MSEPDHSAGPASTSDVEPRALDTVVRALLGPLMRLETPSPTGWRLVGWDSEQGVNFTLGRGDSLLLFELDERDENLPTYARTARFNVSVRHAFQAGRALDDAERAVAEQAIGVLRRTERDLPEFVRPQTSRRAEVREIRVERVLIPEGAGHYYINPYAGCMIGCEYCYVGPRADLSRKLEGLPHLPWGRWVDVKVNAAEVLRAEVKRHPPGIVRFSPILTDPYQPLERRFRTTRACLEVLLDAGFTPVMLTRGASVLDDLDLLRRFPKAAVGFSLPTDDDRMRVRFEPGADPIDERLDALRRCHEAGLVTYAAIQPVLPMDVDHLVAEVGPRVRAVRVDRMHFTERVMHLYEAAGCPEAATDAFFRRTVDALVRGFARHGVRIDELDDLGGALGLL